MSGRVGVTTWRGDVRKTSPPPRGREEHREAEKEEFPLNTWELGTLNAFDKLYRRGMRRVKLMDIVRSKVRVYSESEYGLVSRSLNETEVRQCLAALQKYNYIIGSGDWRHRSYWITNEGRDRLRKEREQLRKELEEERT